MDANQPSAETQTPDDVQCSSAQTLAQQDSEPQMACQTEPQEESYHEFTQHGAQTADYMQPVSVQTLARNSSQDIPEEVNHGTSPLHMSPEQRTSPRPPSPKSSPKPSKPAEASKSPKPPTTPAQTLQVANEADSLNQTSSMLQGQVILVPSVPTTRENFSGRTACILGIIQIAGGLATIGGQAVLTAVESVSAYGAAGFWCGIFFILGGAYGIAAGHRKTGCQIVTYLIMAIVAAVFTLGIFISDGVGLSVDKHSIPGNNWPIAMAFHVLMLMLAALMLITFTVAAILCGRVLYRNNGTQTVIPIPEQYASNQSILLLPPGSKQVSDVPSVQYAIPYPGSYPGSAAVMQVTQASTEYMHISHQQYSGTQAVGSSTKAKPLEFELAEYFHKLAPIAPQKKCTEGQIGDYARFDSVVATRKKRTTPSEPQLGDYSRF